MLKVKGSVPISIRNYVKNNYSNRYNEWFNNLPGDAKLFFSGPLKANEWINSEIGAVLPTQKMADLFYNKDCKKAAWESGRYSAETALTGVYKVFVMIASPKYMIDRASKILVTFYEPSVMQVIEHRPKGVTLHITHLPDANYILEYRIGGWMEKALEICGCKGLKIKITRSISLGDKVTEYVIDWI